jgi:hypothetical protein
MSDVAYFVVAFPRRHPIGEVVCPMGVRGRIAREMTRDQFVRILDGPSAKKCGVLDLDTKRWVPTREIPADLKHFYFCTLIEDEAFLHSL